MTLYFTKLFTRGPLKGLTYHSSMTFTDGHAAMAWVKGINKNANRLNYKIIDKSFQKYSRD
jgi:hypothetical protein